MRAHGVGDTWRSPAHKMRVWLSHIIRIKSGCENIIYQNHFLSITTFWITFRTRRDLRGDDGLY